MVNRENMELWAQALESERYVQCVGSLRIEVFEVEGPQVRGAHHHCALGVGMAVAQAHGVLILPTDWEESTLPPRVMAWYGLDTDNPDLDLGCSVRIVNSVVGANDDRKLPFWDIAQLLRAKYLKDEE